MFNRKPKKNINYMLLVFFVIVIIFFSLVFSKYGSKSGFFNDVRNFLFNSSEVITRPFRKLSDNFKIIGKSRELFNENEKLKIELNNYSVIKDKNNELELEIIELKELLSLNNLYTSYEIINATVIDRNTLYWFNNIVIDKGSKDGISVDDAVVTSKGLIGKVISVTKDNSVVKLITSKDSNIKLSVGVKGSDGYHHGAIIDYKDNLLVVEGITNYDGVNINSKVITSGLGTYDAGILVGYVKRIENDNYGVSKILYVETNQDMNDLKYVIVLGNK
jgi:rod shape-determining protein MreC